MAHFRENTVEAFENALAMGVRGLETDAFVTSDGVVVLDHDGVLRRWWYFGGRPFARVARAALPPHVPTLDDLYLRAGRDIDISIDVKGEDTVEALLDTVRRHPVGDTKRLWLAHKGYDTSDWREVARWRNYDAEVHLIDSTSPDRFDLSAQDYANRAADNGIEVLNMRSRDWTQELVDTALTAGLKPFAFGVRDIADAYKMVAMGMHGLFGDDVGHLLAVKALERP